MSTPARATTEAAAYLCDLLMHREAYRELWARRVVQAMPKNLNQAAVGRVLAEYLVDSGERADTPALHRQIKDRVARLVSKGTVSTETLGWFVAAFDLGQEHTEHLWELHEGSNGSGYVTGGWPPRTSAMQDQGLRTVSLHEFHTLGPDGSPASHRTVQVVRAVEDSVRGYLYRFDTAALEVKVKRGGAPGPILDLHNGLHALEITFNHPLSRGGTCSLEYETTFRYPTPPAPEFRRGVVTRLDNLEIRVQFDPARRPEQVWWASWTDLESPISSRERVLPDAEGAVHRYLDGVEAAIVGFTWAWSDESRLTASNGRQASTKKDES